MTSLPVSRRRGVAPRVLESWHAPGRVVRGLRDIAEGALLALLLTSMLIFLLAQAPGLSRAATLDPSVSLGARIGGAVLAVIFLMPLVAYAVAQLVSLASRITRWRLAPHDSRLALFWALLAVAPAMLLAGLVAGFLGAGPALTVTRLVAGVGFLWIWGAGIAALAVRA